MECEKFCECSVTLPQVYSGLTKYAFSVCASDAQYYLQRIQQDNTPTIQDNG